MPKISRWGGASHGDIPEPESEPAAELPGPAIGLADDAGREFPGPDSAPEPPDPTPDPGPAQDPTPEPSSPVSPEPEAPLSRAEDAPAEIAGSGGVVLPKAGAGDDTEGVS